MLKIKLPCYVSVSFFSLQKCFFLNFFITLSSPKNFLYPHILKSPPPPNPQNLFNRCPSNDFWKFQNFICILSTSQFPVFPIQLAFNAMKCIHRFVYLRVYECKYTHAHTHAGMCTDELTDKLAPFSLPLALQMNVIMLKKKSK